MIDWESPPPSTFILKLIMCIITRLLNMRFVKRWAFFPGFLFFCGIFFFSPINSKTLLFPNSAKVNYSHKFCWIKNNFNNLWKKHRELRNFVVRRGIEIKIDWSLPLSLGPYFCIFHFYGRTTFIFGDVRIYVSHPSLGNR